MAISRDEWEVLIEAKYDEDDYDYPAQRAFAALVAVASYTYELYIEGDKVDIEDPDSFVPHTLGGVPLGWAMIQGLIENLEMAYPDANFRTHGLEK
jgi:hypothetical protein